MNPDMMEIKVTLKFNIKLHNLYVYDKCDEHRNKEVQLLLNVPTELICTVTDDESSWL